MANGEQLFLGAHVFKTHPDENTQLFDIHHISHLVKL